MKKIIFILFTMLILSCCLNSQNINKSSKGGLFDEVREIEKRKTMYLYDTKGIVMSSCIVYKDQFDGHTWYVFYGSHSSPCVIHDPLCNCVKK